ARPHSARCDGVRMSQPHRRREAGGAHLDRSSRRAPHAGWTSLPLCRVTTPEMPAYAVRAPERFRGGFAPSAPAPSPGSPARLLRPFHLTSAASSGVSCVWPGGPSTFDGCRCWVAVNLVRPRSLRSLRALQIDCAPPPASAAVMEGPPKV